MKLIDVYSTLLEAYGPQGWWPLLGHVGTNPTKTGSVCGYHVGDYSFPRDDGQRFEICAGAILTQNTAWPNVEKALCVLRRLGPISPETIMRIETGKLCSAIRPCGYYNMKARKLLTFAEFYCELKGRIPARNELLGIWGIGPETADSMLLYAFAQTEMVVDAYTRRIMAHLKLIDSAASYAGIKEFCEKSLPRSLCVYQEFHALMVEHAKRHYTRHPYVDPLLEH